MSAFEFFFSFYGLLLGLSVAVIATGLATAIQHRHKVRIGWTTPLLALFVALDIATFWDQAWNNFRDLPFTYGLLVVGLAIALVYFIAATLVFPHTIKDGDSLDDHFWANKTVVLWLLIAANLLAFAFVILINIEREGGLNLIISYCIGVALYLVLVIPAASARRPRLYGWTMGAHVVIYVLIAGLSIAFPTEITVARDNLPSPRTGTTD